MSRWYFSVIGSNEIEVELAAVAVVGRSFGRPAACGLNAGKVLGGDVSRDVLAVEAGGVEMGDGGIDGA